MVALDPSLGRPFEALKDAVQSEEALRGLLEIEGLPVDTPAAEYIAHMVRQTFLEPVQWQVSEIREAFFRALPSPSPPPLPRGKSSERSSKLLLLPRPSVLGEIIRGKSPQYRSTSSGADVGGQGGLAPLPLVGESVGVQGRGGGGDRSAGRAAGVPWESVKDFDFREAFTVYEDRDLLACAPLREVGAA